MQNFSAILILFLFKILVFKTFTCFRIHFIKECTSWSNFHKIKFYIIYSFHIILRLTKYPKKGFTRKLLEVLNLNFGFNFFYSVSQMY